MYVNHAKISIFIANAKVKVSSLESIARETKPMKLPIVTNASGKI
jgi:hypothetical protein